MAIRAWWRPFRAIRRALAPGAAAVVPGDYRLTRWLFVRLLALVYLVAFLSLWVQIEGLVGSRGILPVAEFLERFRLGGPESHVWRLPTLLWWSDADWMLHALCGTGCLLAVALLLGVAPLLTLLLAWFVYLSLCCGGQVFLSFQWDALLLEAGFVALWWAPARMLPGLPRSEPAPSWCGLWLVRLLVFKLMLLSGATKLLSLDPTWLGLTALDYHYFTQPLPTWTSWYAHLLPAWLQKVSVAIMFAIEIVAPFGMFCGAALRRGSAILLILLQLGIATTGNYGFFNLLSIVLCLALLDDGWLTAGWRSWIRRPLLGDPGEGRSVPRFGSSRWARRLRITTAAALALVSGLAMTHELVRTGRGRDLPRPIRATVDGFDSGVLSWAVPHVLQPLARFRTINGYGLFRTMTTERPEIVIEVSQDGRAWRELVFRYKPGQLDRPPPFVGPHMPRLDWQMWFAALRPQRAYWLKGLLTAVLEARPEVIGLLGDNELAPAPRYVRMTLYRYEFTDWVEGRTDGRWWRRSRVGPLTRTLTLADVED